jgi:predicted O-methyltransferase YrrM
MKIKFKKILGKRLYSVLYRIYITRSLKHTIHCIEQSGGFDANSGVSFLFSKDAKHIKPMQYPEELLELAKMIEVKRPETVLEIGTARGGTLFLASQLAADNALIVSIDLPDGMYGGGYPEWKIPLYKAFKKRGQKIELIQGDSHTEEIVKQLQTILNGRKIDYLFIDGDHTYEGVKQDFETYSRFLAPKAVVAFHDIVTDKSAVPDHFVHRYWNEIKNNYKYREFVKDKNQSKLGLGVLEIN